MRKQITNGERIINRATAGGAITTNGLENIDIRIFTIDQLTFLAEYKRYARRSLSE